MLQNNINEKKILLNNKYWQQKFLFEHEISLNGQNYIKTLLIIIFKK